MYTCLLHERIIKNTQIAVMEALEYDQKRCSEDSRRIPANLPELQVLMDHVQHIVKNTYLLTKDGIVRRQKIGLPMGTNSAPELANLTLYVEESQYIDALVSSPNPQDLELAKDHAVTQRLIDDLKTWDVEPPPKEIYGLEWSETTKNDGSVIFLGGKLQVINGRLDISVFDKAVEWNFPLIRYPHFDSNVPYHQPFGVFQGQLVRFRSICNTIRNFKHATTQLTLRMLRRGHKPHHLSKGWNAHLNRFTNDRFTNYSRLRQWFRRMMLWAIHNFKSIPTHKTHQQWIPKQKTTVYADPQNIACTEEINAKLATVDSYLSSFISTSNVESQSLNDNLSNFQIHSSFENLLTKYKDDSRLTASQQETACHLLFLSRKREGLAQSQGKICSFLCPKCDLKFVSATSVQAHQTQARYKPVCLQACQLREFLLKLESQQHSFEQSKQDNSNGLTSNFWDSVQLSLSSIQETAQEELPILQTPDYEYQLQRFCANWKTHSLFFNALGLSGSLLTLLMDLLNTIPPQCQLALSKIGSCTVTLKMISQLISGITFHPEHASFHFYISRFYSSDESWFENDHLECILGLLYTEGYFDSEGRSYPLVLTPSFYPLLLSDVLHCMEWFKTQLLKMNLLVDDGIIVNELLVPVCASNAHWILLHFNFVECTFFPINPCHPTDPNDIDYERCSLVVESLCNTFKLPNIRMQMPPLAQSFPTQTDDNNCGIFITMYCLAFIQGISQPFLSVDEYRLLIAIWLLTKSKPSLHISCTPAHAGMDSYLRVGV